MRTALLFALSALTLSGLAQTITPIDSIQRMTEQDLLTGNDLSYLHGDTVTIEGIVTQDPCDYALSTSGSRIGTYLQAQTGAPWEGMHVIIDPSVIGYPGTLSDLNDDVLFLDNFKVGNKVKVKGIVTDFSGLTQLSPLPEPSAITGIGTMPAPVVVTVDSFMQNDGGGGQTQQLLTGEKWESVYVELQNVTVIDNTPNGSSRFFVTFSDAQGNHIRMRDLSGHFRNDDGDDYCNGFGSGQSNTPTTYSPPPLGSFLSYVRGVIFEFNDWYYIAPTDPSDIGPITSAPPVVGNIVRDPVVATSSQTVTVSADISDPDGVVTSAILYYSTGLNNTTYTPQAMTLIATDRYEATIPASGTDGEYMNFYIRAIDDEPDTTNTAVQVYRTLDNGIDEIRDIQFTPFATGSSLWTGDTLNNVSIDAVVTAAIHGYDLGLLTVQDDTQPWSSIYVRKSTGDNVETLHRGDSIRITAGNVFENFNVTYLRDITFQHLGQATVPDPVSTLNIDSVRMGLINHAEAYESMLVRFNDVFVVDSNPDIPSNFGEFEVHGDSTQPVGLRINEGDAFDVPSNSIPFNFNLDSLTLKQELAYVQGMLHFSFGNWKVEMRNLNDLAGFSYDYPKQITTFAFLFQPTNDDIFCNIDHDSLKIICDSVYAGTDITNLAPYIEYNGESVSPDNGVFQDFSSAVSYTVTAPVDGSQQVYRVEALNVQPSGLETLEPQMLQLYPNPATDVLHMAVADRSDSEVVIRIVTTSGMIMSEMVANMHSRQAISLPIGGLPSGLYLLELVSARGAATKAFVVSR